MSNRVAKESAALNGAVLPIDKTLTLFAKLRQRHRELQ